MNLDDQATNTEELHRSIALKLRRPILAKLGICYNCREPLDMRHNFCDFDCQQDYLRREENKKGKE